VRVAYRRVCILRVSGKNEEAEALVQGKLASLVAQAKEELPVTEVELDALFASEEERVDNAHTVAEILLPLLTANGVATLANGNGFLPRAADPARRMEAATSFPQPSEPAPNESQGGGPMLPGIADFIDEMLTQERSSAEAPPLRRPA